MAKNDINFKAISFLIKLVSISYPSQSKEAFTRQLQDLFGNEKTLINLAIYGNNKPMNLNGLIIIDSRFVGYKNFSKSNFTDAKVQNSYFESCHNQNPSKTLTKQIFNSCRLGDLESAIESSEEKSEKEREIVEGELRNFFSSFFHRGAFTDNKLTYVKMSKRIKSINRSFFERLVREGVLQVKVEKSDETYYIVSSTYEDSVYGFLSNNKIDGKMEKVFKLIE